MQKNAWDIVPRVSYVHLEHDRKKKSTKIYCEVTAKNVTKSSSEWILSQATKNMSALALMLAIFIWWNKRQQLSWYKKNWLTIVSACITPPHLDLDPLSPFVKVVNKHARPCLNLEETTLNGGKGVSVVVLRFVNLLPR